ncbi:MAG TPA: tetrahydrofolate dehydrogenase/cyclohydrolase catalytic domain-containing protein [Bacteroidales bacterium]|nr:tetrahydrofolate dehydrogenase/cyclohydrolase catalytic domain-containing protein [Bacteroidales bacterium]HPS16747.1 tetrahydrofolate dehydrogenase/cyclohydrolase catalytic domain-containing protein [Bacteroidales bacterium]
MELIDGKKIAEDIRTEIANEVRKMLDKGIKAPHLAAVLVGDDPASHTYVANKEKACKEVGFMSSVYKYPATMSEKDLLDVVEFLNNDDEIDGFIVQVPLPKHINPEKVIRAIKPEKDVDGFHPVNIGNMVLNLPGHIPATPYGIMQLIKRAGIETEGKHCVVVGRSNNVGTPVSILLSRNNNEANCTVTLCHSKTKNIKEICAGADILIAAIGKMEFIKADMVKDGAVVIDVGIHRVESSETKSGFRLKGDVAFNEVSKKCSRITPVPGGVGPMTIVGLLMNTLRAAKKEVYI